MTTNQAAGDGGIGLGALVAYLDELLEAGKGSDFGPNGLQVEGRERVHKVVTGVSACLQLFARRGVLPGDLRQARSEGPQPGLEKRGTHGAPG